MRLLYVHGHKIKRVKKNGRYLFFTTGGLNNNVLERYLKFCNEVIVIGRIVDEKDVDDKWSRLSVPNVCIVNNKHIPIKRVFWEIKKCDNLIIRMPSDLGNHAILLNRIIKKPYLIEMVGCPWDSLWNHSIKGKIVAPFSFIINKILLWNATNVLYVTDEFLQKRYPTKGKSIGCSDVVLTEFDDSIIEKRISKIKNHNGKTILGTLAGIDVKYKGQQFVIEALGVLKKKGITNYEYQLVGNGSKKYLKQIARENDVLDQVVFVGGKPHEEINEWLDSIDIYIQPSLQEGLPRALVEAMSRALPAIGSDAGGIPELLDKNVIFPKKNVKKLVDVLHNMNKEKMLVESRRNYIRSQDYKSDVLNKKRNSFYLNFFNNHNQR